jgi:hypothetical protein
LGRSWVLFGTGVLQVLYHKSAGQAPELVQGLFPSVALEKGLSFRSLPRPAPELRQSLLRGIL